MEGEKLFFFLETAKPILLVYAIKNNWLVERPAQGKP